MCGETKIMSIGICQEVVRLAPRPRGLDDGGRSLTWPSWRANLEKRYGLIFVANGTPTTVLIMSIQGDDW